MKIIDLKTIDYEKARALQHEAVLEVAGGGEPRLFLLEHEPVITVGRHGGMENLHVDPDWLERQGIALCKSERGGNITCHYPGQLVAYPVFPVSRRGGLKRLFHDVEEVAIRTLDAFGVAARRAEGRPGVWTGRGKIASIGIAVRKWVSYHGLSLNVYEDTSLFDLITLCGLNDAQPTSLHAETAGDRPAMEEVKNVLAGQFEEIFAQA
jgi:lipoyl(octanoyl) transferase